MHFAKKLGLSLKFAVLIARNPLYCRAPSAQMWSGNPIAFIRKLSKEEQGDIEKQANAIAELADEHKDQFLPYGTTYQLRE